MTFSRTIYLAIVLIACPCLVFSQNRAKDAKEMYKTGNFLGAIPIYEQLIKAEPENTEFLYNLALCYMNTNVDKTLAAPLLEKAVQLPKVEPAAFYFLPVAYTFAFDYDKAEKAIQEFGSRVPDNFANEFKLLKQNIVTAKTMIRNPVNVKIENLGSTINSEYADYYPYITRNEDLLVYTSRRKGPGATIEFDGYYNSDIYYCANWQDQYARAKNLGRNVNTIYDEEVVGLSGDGSMMFVYLDHIDLFGDIFISTAVNSKYSRLVQLGTNVNSVGLETSASLSNDGNTMFFTSRRENGLGGLDIYMARKLPNDDWGIPQNLGSQVNTPYDEDFPFLADDGETLYFSSNGHPGMGGSDLFFSKWDSDKNTWSKAENLGYPINSPFDDKTISFSGDGMHAYISAAYKDGFGDLDIYRISFEDRKSPPAIFVMNVSGSDQGTPNLTPDLVVLTEHEDLFGIYRANANSGEYLVPLQPGKYYIQIEEDGYAPYLKPFEVTSSQRKKLNEEHVVLQSN